jgi:hypothetical protein
LVWELKRREVWQSLPTGFDLHGGKRYVTCAHHPTKTSAASRRDELCESLAAYVQKQKWDSQSSSLRQLGGDRQSGSCQGSWWSSPRPGHRVGSLPSRHGRARPQRWRRPRLRSRGGFG